MARGSTYSAGTAFLTVVPSFLGIEEAFKKQVRDMAKAADKDLAAGVAAGLKQAQAQARDTGSKAGKDFGGAYETEVKKRLNAAWKSLPAPDPDVKLRKWDKALASVRSEMKDLAGQRIGIDIDPATFDKAVEGFRKRLEDLRSTAGGANKNANLFNVDQALGGLGDLQKFSADARAAAEKAGDDAGSAFNQRMAKALQGAEKIPPIKLNADTSEAERKFEALRVRMVELQSKRIGIDIDAGEAYAELKAINFELNRLDRKNVQVDVRTNAHEAAAGMSAFITQAEKAGQATEGIGRSSSFSMSRLEYLIALGASLGTSIVPAAGAAAAAIGLIGQAGLGALAGVGTIALAVNGVGDAVKALDAYQKDQTKSSTSVDQANRRVAGSTDQVRMAQESLANTRRKVGQAAQDAAEQVKEAERGVGDARRQAGIDVANAARQVRDAKTAAAKAIRDVGDARRQAAIDNADATRSVRDAQRDLTDSEGEALSSRKALNEAIEAATRDIEEMGIAVDRNTVDQHKAVTAQMKALAELNALKMNPRASEIELRQAQDSYDEQTVRLEELKQKQKELQQDKAKADRQGVEGDNRVIAARKRIKSADETVSKAREKVSREQQQQHETEIKSAERIRDAREQAAKAQERVGTEQQQQAQAAYQAQSRVATAERNLAKARRDQDRQRQDGQFQIAQASNAVTQAARSQAGAWDKVGTAGGAALQNLNWQMSQLSPAQQHFAKFLYGLKGSVGDLQAAAAEPMLPQFETAITKLLPYLPKVEAFISKVAGKIGELGIRAVDALGDPVWQRFFDFVDRTAVPSLETMFQVGENFTEGLISLFLALTPFNKDIGGGLVKLSKDFAEWADRFDKTKGYQEFLSYIRENGPRVVHFLGQLGELFIHLVEASAPMGAVVLKGLSLLIGIIDSIPIGTLQFLVGAIGAVSLTLSGLGAVLRVNKFRKELGEIFGPKMSSMVQQYALDTGRATQETGKFKTMTATVSGVVSAAGDKVKGAAASVANFGTKLGGIASNALPVGRAMTAVRNAASGAVGYLNGPGGLAAAAGNAGKRVQELAANATLAATGGLSKVRGAIMEVATATQGPGGLAAGVQAAGGKLTGLASTAGTAASQMSASIGRGVQVAGGKLSNLAKMAGTAASSVGTKMVSGMSSAVAFMGGPWAVALVGATLAIGYFAAKQAQQKANTESLKTSLGQLRQTYDDLAQSGQLASSAADKQFKDLVAQNPDLQKAVLTLNNLGLSFDDLMHSATTGDVAKPVAALDAEIKRLNDEMRKPDNFLHIFDNEKRHDRIQELYSMRDAFTQNASSIKQTSDAMNLLSESDKRNIAMGAIVKNNTGATTTALGGMATAWDKNQIGLDALTTTLGNFGTGADKAKARADDLTAAIQRQYGAAMSANEASEKWHGTLLTLSETVHSNGRSLDINSRAGLSNRDALEAAAQASRDMFVEEVKAGGKLPEVTKKHEARITALKEEARKLGLTKGETDKLIDTYGKIDPSITTKYTTAGFDAVFLQAQKLRFAQFLLEQGITDPAEATRLWKQSVNANTQAHSVGGLYDAAAAGARAAATEKAEKAAKSKKKKHATGGEIEGVGTGTSDSNLILASKGEHMLTDAEVRTAGGHDVIYAWRQALLAKGGIPSPADLPVRVTKHATGGEVGKGQQIRIRIPAFAKGGAVAPFPVDMSMTKFPTFNQLKDRWGQTAGALGTASGGAGYQWQEAVLKAHFPNIVFTSTTGGGHAPNSWHYKGRAVDMIPHTREVMRWIHDTYGGSTLELIGPYNDLDVWHGTPHTYSKALQAQHQNHIHWAYDQGGWLEPGAQRVVNMTGKPEPVLSPNQWQTMEQFVSQGMAGGQGATYNFEFADTTLTPTHLRSLQQRQDAMSRVGRPR